MYLLVNIDPMVEFNDKMLVKELLESKRIGMIQVITKPVITRKRAAAWNFDN